VNWDTNVITLYQEQHNTVTGSGVCNCTFKPQHHQMLIWLTYWPELLRFYTQLNYLWWGWAASDFIRVSCFFLLQVVSSFQLFFVHWLRITNIIHGRMDGIQFVKITGMESLLQPLPYIMVYANQSSKYVTAKHKSISLSPSCLSNCFSSTL
jgi:hypothetical protein